MDIPFFFPVEQMKSSRIELPLFHLDLCQDQITVEATEGRRTRGGVGGDLSPISNVIGQSWWEERRGKNSLKIHGTVDWFFCLPAEMY